MNGAATDQAALEQGGQPASAVLSYDGLPPLIARALQFAAAELAAGVSEVPLGSNRGPRVDVYLNNAHPVLRCFQRYIGNVCPVCKSRGDILPGCRGAAWCAAFARWAYEAAAAELALLTPFAAANKACGSDLAGHYKWLDFAQAHKLLVKTPAPGDVGLLIPSPHAGHVVLVASVDGDSVITIEGNHEDRVTSCRRPIASITHFVRVVPA